MAVLIAVRCAHQTVAILVLQHVQTLVLQLVRMAVKAVAAAIVKAVVRMPALIVARKVA